MTVTGVGLSDVGQKRTNNEDAFHVDDTKGLFIVADGMGGHKGGEVASSTAIQSIARSVSPEAIAALGDGGDNERLSSTVEDAVTRANKEIRERAGADPELTGMGCALSVMLCVGEYAMLGHVGDTRIYRLRKGAVEQLTEDHTFVGELVRSGTVDAADMRRHPHGHVLTRAMGSQDDVEVDTLLIDLRPGDRFLLCSDGLTNYVEDPGTLAAPLAATELSSIPQTLVKWANDAGGGDNVTVVAVGVD